MFHAPFVAADPDFSLDVIVTANPERAAEARRLHPDARVVDSAEDAIAADVDLVVVGSPPATHAPLAHAALDAGHAVLVDKPFAVTSAEGRELVEKADRLGHPLTVFQNRRWDGDYLTLQRLVRDGALGDVRRFESRFEWWKPSPPASWKAESPVGEGGGILFDLGAHLIDQALQLFGPIDDLYSEVRTLRPGAAADDDAFLALRHTSGTISHLWMNSLAAQFGPALPRARIGCRLHQLGPRSAGGGVEGRGPALRPGLR